MTTLRGRLPSLAIGLVAVVDVATGVLTFLSTGELYSIEGRILVSLLAVEAMLAALVALWIVLRSPARRELRALAIGLAGLALFSNLALGPEWSGGVPALGGVLRALANAGLVFGSLGLLQFFTLFPKPITPSAEPVHLRRANTEKKRQRLQRDIERSIRIMRRIQSPGLWKFATGFSLLAGLLAFGLSVWGSPTGFDPDGIVLLTLAMVTGSVLPISVAAVTQAFQESTGMTTKRFLWLRFTPAGGSPSPDTRRLLWIRWGVTAASMAGMMLGALLLVGIVIGFESTLLVRTIASVIPLPPLLFLLGLLVAVFYDGSLDPSLAIRRTAIYGALGTVFVFLFAGLGNVVSELVEARLGLPGALGTALYGGTVAVVLLPLRGWMTRVSQRWMPEREEGDQAP